MGESIGDGGGEGDCMRGRRRVKENKEEGRGEWRRGRRRMEEREEEKEE